MNEEHINIVLVNESKTYLPEPTLEGIGNFDISSIPSTVIHGTVYYDLFTIVAKVMVDEYGTGNNPKGAVETLCYVIKQVPKEYYSFAFWIVIRSLQITDRVPLLELLKDTDSDFFKLFLEVVNIQKI